MEENVQKVLSEVLERMTQLEKRMNEIIMTQKEMMSFEEARQYLNLSRSYLHKLCSSRLIQYFKPGGKLVYFKRADLDEWLKRHVCAPAALLKTKAIELLHKNGKKPTHK